MSPLNKFEYAQPSDKPRRGLFGAREKAQEAVKPETQRQIRTVRNNVDQSRTLRGPMNAANVQASFPRNVSQIRCSDGQIATRAENGFFYLPGRSGEKAFYLAAGESATAMSFDNNPGSRGAEKKKNIFSRIFNKTDTAESSFAAAAQSGREVFSGNTTDARLSTAANRSRESQRNMEYFYNINSLVLEAIQKDAKGNWIEGGLIGGLTRLVQSLGNKRTNVGKLIERLEKQDPGTAQRLQVELTQAANNLRNSTSTLSNVGQSLLGVVGVRNGRERSEMLDGSKKMNTGAAIKGLTEAVATSAVMSALTGSPSVYLGSLRIPFTNIQNLPNPDKDRIARAVAGVSYSQIAGGAAADLDTYSDNYNKSTSRRDNESLSVLESTRAANDAIGYNLGTKIKKVAGLFEFRDKANAKKLTNPEVSDNEKIQIVEAQIREINRELANPWRRRSKDENRHAALEEATVFLENLTGTQRLSQQYESFSYTGDMAQASKFLTGAQSFDEFEQRFSGKYDSAITPNIEAFYNGDKSQLAYLSGHLAPMARAYARGGRELQRYLNGPLQMREGLQGVDLYSSKDKRYFNGNTIKIGSNTELADFVDSAAVRSNNTPPMRLADVYARNIAVWSRGSINVQSSDIIQGLQSAREARLTTKNSTVDNLQLPSKSYTGKQWEFMAPASMIIVNPQTGRDETVTAYLRLGIKPNCMNLQPIGITYDRGENWYDITNGTAGIPLRVPLSYSWKKKGEKPDQPKRTKKPDRPDRPDRPRGPDTPETPRDQVSSTPDGKVIDAPTDPGYNANITETHHQNIDNTDILVGPNRPGTDGIATGPGSNIPQANGLSPNGSSF